MQSSSELKDTQREQHDFRARLMLATVLMLAGFGLLLARLIWLQVIQHEHYHTLAESNRISLVPIVPNRGLILDRNGIVLAQNHFVYTLEVTPGKVEDLEHTLKQLGKLVEISDADLKRFHRLRRESHGFEGVMLRSNLTELETARFAVNRYRFPGVEIRARLLRHYPLGPVGAHLIGYVGRINDQEVAKLKESGEYANYLGTDHIGKIGIEQYYERRLHGKTGIQQVEINADGHAVRVLSVIPPIAGDDIYLTVDIKLQKIAEHAFAGRRGALVAMNPTTGEVLAYVSQPSFDPNLFVDGIDTKTWKMLNESPDRPMINRPLRGIYPPGSTFKPFVALAGLEAGKRMPPFSIYDPGYFTLPGNRHRYRNWKPEGHGIVDMRRAITVSCDTFFYGLAHELGVKPMTDFVRQFGFGQNTGIDLSGELSGLLPTPEWKQRRFKQPWYPGETVIVGIGQGYTLATPMQLAYATAILANDGVAMRPHLVSAIRDSKSGIRQPVPSQVVKQVQVRPQNAELVRQAMLDVTRPGGTAVSVGAGAPYNIAAKTGTAQVIGIKQGEKYDASKIDERHRDHALFIAYAPAEAPTIAVALIVENGGSGGSTAGPIARQVMDYYLLGKEPTDSSSMTTPAVGPSQQTLP